jgi:hypothetical protein
VVHRVHGDLSVIRPRIYLLAELTAAMDAAATAGSLEYVAVRPQAGA